MGKNQQHKMQQQTRHSSSTTGEAGQPAEAGDGLVDASFHTPEWHAARIAALTTERMTWEDWKIKKKEDDKRRAAEEDEEESRMREYRKQLDAERASKLGRGRNHLELRDKSSKKRKRKDGSKDKKKKKSSKKSHKDGSKEKKDKKHKKKKRSRRSSSGSSSDDSDSDSGSSGDEQAKPGEEEGSMRLSDFFH